MQENFAHTVARAVPPAVTAGPRFHCSLVFRKDDTGSCRRAAQTLPYLCAAGRMSPLDEDAVTLLAPLNTDEEEGCRRAVAMPFAPSDPAPALSPAPCSSSCAFASLRCPVSVSPAPERLLRVAGADAGRLSRRDASCTEVAAPVGRVFALSLSLWTPVDRRSNACEAFGRRSFSWTKQQTTRSGRHTPHKRKRAKLAWCPRPLAPSAQSLLRMPSRGQTNLVVFLPFALIRLISCRHALAGGGRGFLWRRGCGAGHAGEQLAVKFAHNIVGHLMESHLLQVLPNLLQ